MTTNTNEKAAGAINTNGLHTDTNSADFPTTAAQGKAIAADNLTALASDINRHHENACLRADEAINHAMAAGKLLLQAKAAVPHGEWLGWVGANIRVTPRQVQRYIAAALGKPLPLRAIKGIEAAYTTSVSHLPVNAGEAISVKVVKRNWFSTAYVIPSRTHPGFHFYAIFSGEVRAANQPDHTDQGCNLFYGERPIRSDFLQRALEMEMPDWRDGAIERWDCAGVDRHPFVMEGDAA